MLFKGSDYRIIGNDIVIFLHIPKTGGVSVHKLLEKVYKERYFRHSQTKKELWQNLTYTDISAIKCISGHLKFGVHRKMRRSAKYITIVRDPIERVVSLFHQKEKRKQRICPSFNEKYTIDSWVNEQLDQMEKKFYTQCEIISGKNNFKIAKSVLNLNYLCYCDISQADEMANFLLDKLDVKDSIKLDKVNVRPDYIEKKHPSDITLTRLKSFFSEDFKLVEFCSSEFEKVKLNSPEFKQ